MSNDGYNALNLANQIKDNNATNLIPADMSSIQFMRQLRAQWASVREQYYLGTFREMRAAYACSKYQILTDHFPPACNDGVITCPKDIDKQARNVITKELGHGNAYRTSPYIGGRR